MDIEKSLLELRRLTNTDFAALALASEQEQAIRWRFASGNRNDRYKRIVLCPGKGIAGKVMRSGRPMAIHSFSPRSGDDPWEYSILLAEGLQSVLAVPLWIADRVSGVLLVGNRENQRLADDLLPLVTDVAEQLGSFLQKQNELGENGAYASLFSQAADLYTEQMRKRGYENGFVYKPGDTC
jgi:nitrogen regulatory protein A